MKRSLLFILALLTTISYAQNIPFHRCYSHKAIEYQDSVEPGFKDLVDEQFEFAKAAGVQKSGDLYTVPVVFHVVYNTPDQNLEDSVILRQLDILNEDFQRQNPDTVNMRPIFDMVKGNPNIRFKLAQIDPDGNPTTGITRTETSLESFGDLSIITGSFDALERVKKTNEDGIDPWDQDRYMNVWICNMEIFGFTALLGYATPPTGLPNWPPGATAGLLDGVVVQFQTVGDNNPNPLPTGDVKGRTLTHEVGHYLGLRHIWGDGNCLEEDGIDDTPNADAQSEQDCDTTKNTCVDNIFGIDLPDMVENYMDYSAESCQNTFTQGQADLMRAVLENQRIDLIQDNPANTEELKQEMELVIYPNPTDDLVHIEIKNTNVNAVQVTSLDGKPLQFYQLEHESLKIDLSDFAAGVFLVHLLEGEQIFAVRRVVKL